ncbi:MAG: hypothetical protein H0V93_05030 [Euzebyales bacterium]|jgi:hypothetical protein|nr:hypothetical protein [Euzebyales bacterium]
MKILARRVAWVVYLTMCFSLLIVPVANAYIDAGSGSFVFQAVIAFGLASAVAVRSSWGRIRSFFRGRSHPE